jgi:hypothetical protein
MPPPQFRIRSLMLATLVIGVSLGLFLFCYRYLGTEGLFYLLIMSGICCLYISPVIAIFALIWLMVGRGDPRPPG